MLAMHLKQKAYSFGVPLVYTITTISLFSAGGCEPAAPSLQPASPLLRDAPSGSVRIHPPIISEVRRWVHRDSEPTLKNTLEPGLEPRTGTSSKNRFKRRQPGGRRPLISHGPPGGHCSEGHIKLVVPGRFYITGHFGPNLKHLGSHSGSDGAGQGQGKQAKSRGHRPSSSMESWQRLQPSVECEDDAMILTVRRKRAIQLLLDRANGSSSLLFQLPPQCGYFVRVTPRDLSLKAQYNACHVTQEDGSFVLPLLWRGVPVRVSCPVSHNKLPGGGASFLCCSPHGVAFKLQELSAVKEPQISVRGEWTPLLLLVEQCGYTVKKQDEGITIFVPFDTCGVAVKDEKQTLSLRIGKKIYTLACPIQPLKELPIIHQPLADGPPSFTKKVANPKLNLGPFLWVPPFYLAPPNYPHPTYPQPKGRGSSNPTALASVVFSSQPMSQDHYSHQDPLKASNKHLKARRPLSFKDQMKDSGRAHREKQNLKAPDLNALESSAATTDFTVQVEVAPSRPPGHDFSYYHHYHLPKILPPGTPQDPGPGASGRLQSSTKSQSHKFSSMPPNNHQLKSLGNDASDKTSLPFTAPTPYTFPTSPSVSSLPASYPLQFFPYYFFYLPHLKGEAKRLDLLRLDLATKTNQSFVSSYEKHSTNPNLSKSKRYKPGMVKILDGRRFASVTPAVQSPASLSYSHKPDPLSVPPPEQPFLPTPGFTYNADPHKYYYHPYYNNYLPYYVPEAWREKYNHGSQTAPRAAAASSVQPSNRNPHTSHTESMDDIQKRLLHYYYFFYLPQLFKYNQKLLQHDAQKTNQASTSQLSPHFDFGKTQQSVLASEARHSSVPSSMDNPLKSLYSNFITQQRPAKPAQQHGGEGAQWELDKEMKDGTAGQFVYAVPGSVAEPSVAPPAPSSGDGSCLLQKLTSHPDVYFAPSDGCGVNQRMKVDLLDVQGVQSLKDGSSYSPGRLMVGCGSSPGSPGGVRFQMAEPPSLSAQQTPPAVLLRIATDESFGSYYPEAHLPVSLLQNKPVHVELRLLEPSEPTMVLMVHSCLAYSATPEVSWMLFYDSCGSRSVSKLLPSSDSQHISRIKINNFPSLPSESLTYRTPGGHLTLKDPEIYFLCLTEICSAAHNDCRVKCE